MRRTVKLYEHTIGPRPSERSLAKILISEDNPGSSNFVLNRLAEFKAYMKKCEAMEDRAFAFHVLQLIRESEFRKLEERKHKVSAIAYSHMLCVLNGYYRHAAEQLGAHRVGKTTDKADEKICGDD